MKYLFFFLAMIPIVEAQDLFSLNTSALNWEKNNSSAVQWSKVLRYDIDQHFPALNRAKDILDWCPGYDQLSQNDKQDFWAVMMVDVANWESGYQPKSAMREVEGEWSLGLFQLSVEDKLPWCKHATQKDLFDPINNINCAVPMMSRLISQDEVIAKGIDTATAKGAARYWSTLRSGNYLGHRATEIKKTTKEWCDDRNSN
jgi:hypothetical protein